jgi:hypothetical protein
VRPDDHDDDFPTKVSPAAVATCALTIMMMIFLNKRSFIIHKLIEVIGVLLEIRLEIIETPLLLPLRSGNVAVHPCALEKLEVIPKLRIIFLRKY